MAFVRSGDSGGAISTFPAYVKYLTYYNINDSTIISEKSYTITETGCYLILGVEFSSRNGSLTKYTGLNVSLNDVNKSPKRLIDDTENDDGFIIDGCIVQASQNDVLKVSTSGTSGTQSSNNTIIYIFRFMFGAEYSQSNLQAVVFSNSMAGNTSDTVYSIDLTQLSNYDCFGLTFMRRNNTSGYNNSIVAKNPDYSDTYTDTLIDINDSSTGTSWGIRAKLFYPQRYGTATILDTHTGTNNHVDFGSKVVVFGV